MSTKAATDFRSGGRYGADDERMGNRVWDDCDDAYARGFERAERDDYDRREQEEREEQQALLNRQQCDREEAHEQEEYEQSLDHERQKAVPLNVVL